MGVMNEVTELSKVAAVQPQAPQALTAEEFKALCTKGYDGKTEVEIKTGLSFLELYAGIYENGKLTNHIINVNQPWDIRVHFGIAGPLAELICGYWCVKVYFESMGHGREFDLHFPEYEFDCHKKHWCLTIPGTGIRPDYCGEPYKVVVTVQAKSHCYKPVAIVGFVELPLVQFYEA
jgi:hypothetical protein